MTNKIKKQYYLYKAGKRDPEAFAKVYDIYVDKIYRYVYFKVSSAQEAQDITSEVFLKAWAYLEKREKIDNINALLYRIARNLIIDFYRSKDRDVVSGIEEVLENKISEIEDIHSIIDNSFQTKEVLEAIEGLNDLYKEIIILRYLDQLSFKEIASITNKTSGAVRVIAHRALAVLKKKLDK